MFILVKRHNSVTSHRSDRVAPMVQYFLAKSTRRRQERSTETRRTAFLPGNSREFDNRKVSAVVCRLVFWNCHQFEKLERELPPEYILITRAAALGVHRSSPEFPVRSAKTGIFEISRDSSGTCDVGLLQQYRLADDPIELAGKRFPLGR